MNLLFRSPFPRRGQRPGPRKRGGHAPGPKRFKVPKLGLGQAWRAFRAAILAHPRRAAGFAVLGIALLAFIATTSLPLALLPVAPRLVLLLAPGNPYAQLRMAEQERRELIARLTPPAPEPTTPATKSSSAPGSTSGATPSPGADTAPAPARAPEDPEALAADIRRLQADIRERAARVLGAAPLSSGAYRMLGETATSTDAARQALATALALSKREPVAALWLLNDAFQRGDYADVLRKADMLLRTSPELNAYTYSYLQSMASDPEARSALADELKTMPLWRASFMGSLGNVLNTDDGLALFLALKERGAPVSTQEIAHYLRARLFNAKEAQGSYNVWLQLLSDEELARLLPLNNANFATDPSGAPFDWTIARSNNVQVRFLRQKEDPDARALRIEFGIGRLRFGGISQVVFLRPGLYHFEGQQSGTMTAKRGMVWEVRCFQGNALLGQSSQLFGASRGWQGFEFGFTVPELGCPTQVVRLLHDSRSTSEEYASGEILFSKIRLAPAAPAAAGSPQALP